MNRVLVIAANRTQFEYHAGQRAQGAKSVKRYVAVPRWVIDDVEYTMVRAPEHVMSLNDFEVERWGQWWLHPKKTEIEREIYYRQLAGKDTWSKDHKSR